MIGNAIGIPFQRKRGGAAPFDFSSIPGLRLCLLPGQGITEVDGGVDVWNSQFINSYAEAPQASQRPAVQTNDESGLLVPHFDGLDDRLLFKEANGDSLTAGLTTSFMLLKSDGFKTHDSQRMTVFTDFDSGGRYAFIGESGSSSTILTNTFGSPSLRVDEADANPAFRIDVWNLIYGVNAVKLTTITDGDMTTWTTPQIGGYRDATDGLIMYQGEILAKLIYDGMLTQQQIETVESELLKLL